MSACHARKGFGLLEMILGLAIMAGIVIGANRYLQGGADSQMARGIAQRATEINAAADVYMRTQISSIRDALANPGDITVVPLTGGPNAQGLRSMQEVGAIGRRFTGAGPYGQGAQFVIQRNPDIGPAGIFDYEAYVVYPGGRVIPDRILAQATALSDGRTGAVLTRDPSGAGSARGFKGGWEIPAAVLNAAAPTSGSQGRLVSYVSMQKGLGAELQGKWLSRIETGDPLDNRMETNIDAGSWGVNNLNFATAPGLSAQSNLNRPVTPGQIGVAGSIVVDNADAINAGNARVEAPKLSSNLADNARGPDGKPTNAGLSVAGNALIADLSAGRINLDAIAYDGSGSRDLPGGVTSAGDSIRLADLIPNLVPKASWVAGDGDIVPKPSCSTGGDRTRARIYVVSDRNENVSLPVVDVAATLGQSRQTVVDSVSGDGAGGISVTTVSIPVLNSITLDTAVTPGRFEHRSFAVDNGTSWTVFVQSFFYDQNGNKVRHNDNRINKAIVQTSCFYG